MRTGTLVVVCGGVAAALVTALGLVDAPEPVRDGQVVFVAVQVEPAGSGPTVQVQSCSRVADGVRVQGWVAPVESGQQVVAVTPAAPSAPGMMVGAGYATRSGLLAGTPVGSFQVTLPGLDPADATFTVARVDSAGAAVGLGPVTRCPR